MTKIKIDLRDLTPAHLEEAKPHMGRCRYDSPCIIGSLIPEEQRSDPAIIQHRGVQSIGVFELELEQIPDLMKIQEYFDDHDWNGVLEIARRYMKETSNG